MHSHSDVPRDEQGNCATCHQPVRKRSDERPGKKRPRIVISPPAGEEGVLEDLLAQLVEKYEEVWPDELVSIGGRFWLYRAVHFAAYAAVTTDLLPAEEGA